MPRANRVPSVLIVISAITAGIVIRARLAAEHSVYPYDAYYYLGGAKSIATDLAYSFRGIPQTRFQPGYPILTAPVTWLMSTERAGIMVASLAWAAVGIVTYFIGNRVGGRAAGIVAAILVTFNPIATKWASVPMSESVFALALAGGVLALIIAMQDSKPWMLGLAGALGGYAMVTRYEAAVFIPLLAVCVFWMFSDARWRRPGRIIAGAAAASALFALPAILWYLRNRGIETNELAYSDELAQNFDANFQTARERLDYYFWTGQKLRPATVAAYIGMLAGIVRAKREIVLMVLWFCAIVAGHLLWYYIYERFLMGALVALAVSAAWAGVGAVRLLGERKRLRTAVAVAGCAGLAAFVLLSVRVGVNFTHEHILGLNRDWGGETYVTAARLERELPGGSVGNRGALFAYWSDQDTPYVGRVAFDADEIPHSDPVARARYLKERGVERVVLATKGRDPIIALREARLDGAGLELITVTSIDAPFEGMHQITAVYRIPDAP